MFSRPLLLLTLLVGSWCLECGDKKAHYATCMMNPDAKEGTGPKGKIDFAQIPECYGSDGPIEILVSMAGMKPEKKYALVIKRDGDISEGCAATGPIYRAQNDQREKAKFDKPKMETPAASDYPTGFLANYDPQRKDTFKAQSTANLHGQDSVVGRTLVVFDGSYPTSNKPIACCVIGIADGSRFAGKPVAKTNKPKSIAQDTFGYKTAPAQPAPRSESFFETRHPFNTKAAQSLPFTAHDDPKQGGSGFNFDIGSLGSIGPRSFAQSNFGFGPRDSIAGPSGLSPSISDIQKPPSPPAFPGAIRGTDTGSPLFGNIGDNGPRASDQFGFNLGDFTGFSQEETFIPRDGEQTDGPTSDGEYQDQAHQTPDQRYNDQGSYNDGRGRGGDSRDRGRGGDSRDRGRGGDSRDRGRGGDSGDSDQDSSQYADNEGRRYDEPADKGQDDDRQGVDYQEDSQGGPKDNGGTYTSDGNEGGEPDSSPDKEYPAENEDQYTTGDQTPPISNANDGTDRAPAETNIQAGNENSGVERYPSSPLPTEDRPIQSNPVNSQSKYTNPDPVQKVIAKAVAANSGRPVVNPVSDRVAITADSPVDTPLPVATTGDDTSSQLDKVPDNAESPSDSGAPQDPAPAPASPPPPPPPPPPSPPSPPPPSAVPVSNNGYPGNIQPFGQGLPYGSDNGGFGNQAGSFNQPPSFNRNAVPINTYSPSGGPYIPSTHQTANIYNVPPQQSVPATASANAGTNIKVPPPTV